MKFEACSQVSTTRDVPPGLTTSTAGGSDSVSYTHLRAHETPEHLVCRLLLEKKKQKKHVPVTS